ncbi:ribonuclease H-like protein [Coprinopsis marcescibilis]|uniref:3'-5' exonuclease n=1 Tax=Coprinopsis marcescibilis TaxID=230819 RepID=A0A5C3KIQ8_COPMA|nr:ribonuclease H-like protein [Coprinopsis marcescibilis]
MESEQPIPETSSIEKTPPRPAPTEAYSWRVFSSNARISYITDILQAETELSAIQPGPLGFDLEWKPNYRKGGAENPVALVQLANNQAIFLIQISTIRAFPDKLREILGRHDFLKAGVGIQGDTQKLFKDWGVSVNNCVELGMLARTVDNARWKGKYVAPIGLARLVEVYHYRLLEKGKIRRSNWEAVLDESMQNYAANDAHAGYTLYQHLIQMVDPSDVAQFLWFTLASPESGLRPWPSTPS